MLRRSFKLQPQAINLVFRQFADGYIGEGYSRVEVILGLNDIAIPLKGVGGSCCGCWKGEWCNNESLSFLQVQECGVDLVCWSVEGVPAASNQFENRY